ncbi:DNA repair protein [Rhizodiscina lignyota]|uniref:DNA repair protein REV1 n=1 Tax=Rhizodiscina lignyota TaxID=1504668 RepID=A0A9P4MDW5_9PEZI|nr:DNA repair protein [Rhizodiscina lignyota]
MGSRLESNSNAVRKRIENHTFEDEGGEEYEGSKFGGFSDYFRRKKIKLQNLDVELRSKSDDKPNIFRGIVAHVNGYTQPSLNDIHKLIVTHGGGFMQYLDGKTTVTHIICSNLTPKKAVEFKRYRIVKPAWVVESVKAGRLLPWDSFRVLAEGAGQRVLGFQNGKVVSQADVKSRGYRDQTETSWYTSQLKAEEPQSSSASRYLSQKPPTPEIEDEIDDDPTTPSKPTAIAPEGKSDHDLLASPAIVDDEQAAPEEYDARQAGDLEDIGAFDGVDETGGSKGVKRPNSDEQHLVAKRTKLTAEEHNAILLADPKIRKSTVVDPGFLEQYYRESRLHHLSTWKADLKAQMQALAAEKSTSQKQRKKRAAGSRRYILHVDFDSFFAAVSLKKNPQFKDKPAVVAHGTGSGSEIASCNYPARKFGIKNGMWMKRAFDLCPELKILPYDFPAYEEASRAFYEAIIATGGVVQSVSIDEALVDITEICLAAAGSDGKRRGEGTVDREQSKADEIAQSLRDEVKRKTDCNVSVGIGGNILLAKVALRKAKPAGQYQIEPDKVLEFVGKLEVQDLPGVAYSIGGKLEEIGIKFVQDIREVSREKLTTALGPKTGEKIWEYARGIDRAEVGDVVVRKSVSAEVNWGVRFENQEQVDEFIESLCGELMKRLLKERVKGRHLTMKIMRRSADAPLDPPKHLGHGKCDTYNKSVVLGVATNAKEILAKEALSLLKSYGFPPGELRGLGVQMTKLEPMKADNDGQLQSSQRKLQFKVGDAPKADRKEQEDPIQDDIVTPKKPIRHPDDDAIGFGAQQLNISTPSRKPLNTAGTQFVIPTQIDPKVLEELPEDIRAKLAQHMDLSKLTTTAKAQGSSQRGKQTGHTPILAFPNQSQIDLETLNALPADVREEILAFYNQPSVSPSTRRRQDQTLLPQSTRKIRTTAISKKPIPAPAPLRKRGRPSKADTLRAAASNSTLTQSNFITAHFTQPASQDDATTGTESDADEPRPESKDGHDEIAQVPPEILEALPEDIRREILEEQRRARLKKTSGLDLQAFRKKEPAPQPDKGSTIAADDEEEGEEVEEKEEGPIERFLHLPPRPAKPTFTKRKLSSLPDLRDAISAWWSEFRSEGPYDEDIDALVIYLDKVVKEEGDMSKAVGMARWMGWVVEEGLGDVLVGESTTASNNDKWINALGRVRTSVKDAVRARGLGEVDV